MNTRALWQRVDAAPMRLISIGIGIAITLRSLHLCFYTDHLENAALLFPFYGFGWLPRLPGVLALPFLFGVVGCMVWATSNRSSSRYGAILGGLAFTYYFLLDASFFGHLNYALAWCGFFLMLAPPVMHDGDRVPAWMIIAPRLLFAVLYFFAGVVKFYPEWLDGSVILIFMKNSDMPAAVFGWFSTQPVPSVLATAGALFDLTIGPLLLWPKTRRFALIAAVGFHASNMLLVGIYLLPTCFIVLMVTVFCQPSTARRLLKWSDTPPEPVALPADPPPLPARAALAALLLFHLAMPLRPYIYPGDSRWTHEAQHFSWWLRSTATVAEIEVHVVSDQTPREKVDILDYVSKNQAAFANHAPMLVHFARHIAAEREAAGETNVRVYADVLVSVNGRPLRRFVPMDLDLASVEDAFHMEHILLPE